MKKILSIILGLVLLQNICFAKDNVSFIYINGSNNNNEKMKNWYIKGVTKLHPVLKKNFEASEEIKKMSPSGDIEYKVNSEPVIFFWGDKSKQDLEYVQEQLDLTKAFSPTIAYTVRSTLTAFLHDAIWVQKQHNMLPILDDLHKFVMNEYEKGNYVVLYGYSAGTFITYQYLFNKLPYINAENLFNTIDVSDHVRNFVKDRPIGNTCISALSKAQIGFVSDSGHLIFKNVDDDLENNYLKLQEATKVACIPHEAVSGIVNFASPLPLFYSDMGDPDYALNYYNRLMLKYIVENSMFFITVNYREDPLGFPTARNLTIDEMAKVLDVDIKNPTGFIYDNSSVWSKHSALFAHTSYFSSKKTFSNAVVKAFTNGYRLQYDPKFQEKVLNNNKKRIKFEMY